MHVFTMNQIEGGLTTQQALELLHKSIIDKVQEIKCIASKKHKSWLIDAFHPSSMSSIFRLTSAVLLIGVGLILIIYSLIETNGHHKLLWLDGTVVLIICLMNIGFAAWDVKHKHNEFFERINYICRKLKESIAECTWTSENYPHLLTPYSPCISLQWTIRDNALLNIPWTLLVENDIIFLRPGQKVPGKCKPFQNELPSYKYGDIYMPETLDFSSQTCPRVQNTLKSAKYILLETPYLRNITSVYKGMLLRPPSMFAIEKHTVVRNYCENFLIPVFIVLIISVNTLKYIYFSQWCGHWFEMLLLLPSLSILPFIPIVVPLLTFISDHYGVAKLLWLSRNSQSMQSELDPFDYEVPIHIPSVGKKELYEFFMSSAFGKGITLSRTSNLLHTLALLSAFCCVDKYGILSWPNPSPEKVFFLRRNLHQENCCESQAEAENLGNRKHPSSKSMKNQGDVLTEVLDLTHDPSEPCCVRFDDHSWKEYLSSLKPLGLNILLNTCNDENYEDYFNFCSFLTLQSLNCRYCVPVNNNRCLCELAKQIGFTPSATEKLHIQNKILSYKPPDPDLHCQDMIAKSWRLPKMELPYPHMIAMIVKDDNHDNLQIFSQGTGDVIVNSCVDYWNGFDICSLTDCDRKKIAEFYHRYSLTSYCTAFSYSPLNENFRIHSIDGYLKIPHKNSSHDCIMKPDDSLADECFGAQTSQVFIGMVTLQYQARKDIVALIDLLEDACIRFVHFSKENELRSRVFSEKMGLESGWNCHISLLNENKGSDSPIVGMRDMSSSKISLMSTDAEKIRPLIELKKRNSVGENYCMEDFKKNSVVSLSSLESESSGTSVVFDMSNRAKLPRGIENIRPHIEHIDNVPLQVSLFTDSTAAAIQEMIQIMQEYGEVVCIVGSVSNWENMPIFLLADTSIAVEPLYPSFCKKAPLHSEPTGNVPTPVLLAQMLNSLPCSLRHQGKDFYSLYLLISQARHHMMEQKKSLQFLMNCCASFSLLILLSSLLLMPPIFGVTQILFSLCCTLPLVSVSIGTSQFEPNIMQVAMGKKYSITADIIKFYLGCHGAKFLPSIIMVLLCFSLLLHGLCYPNHVELDTMCYLKYLAPDNYTVTSDGNWGANGTESLLFTQNYCSLLFTLYLVIISASYVNRSHYIWIRNPFRNRTWMWCCFTVLIAQLLYFTISVASANVPFALLIENVGWEIWLIGIGWIFVLLPLNEIIKKYELRVNVRYQKRVRLEFGTKLGMNSPF